MNARPALHQRLAFRLYMAYLVFASWKSIERELTKIGKGIAEGLQ